MATSADKLPPYNGEPVDRMSVKFIGAGTGFNGLDIRPIVMDLDDEAHFVVRVKVTESPSHLRDKDDALVRMQRLHIVEMAPLSDDLAVGALQKYAQEIERIKAENDGQLALDDEAAALAREAADLTDSPADIASAAKQRAESGT